MQSNNTMKLIKTIFFDLGNVLFAFDYGRFFKNAQVDGLPGEQVQKRINQLTIELESGQVEETDFLDALQLIFPGLKTRDEAVECWCDIFTLIAPNLAMVRQLKQAGKFHLGVISNTSSLHMAYLRRLSNIFDCFDSLTLSYQIGIMKPAPGIYHEALKNALTKPSECLFFDDREDNVAAANAIGINAYQVTKPDDIATALRLGGL
jgi:FMN phosphatase YigB (HAD superfamily)